MGKSESVMGELLLSYSTLYGLDGTHALHSASHGQGLLPRRESAAVAAERLQSPGLPVWMGLAP